ncbi:MoaD/ThiS family protein [Flavobacterium sp. NG2]|uniref:MoaD/ThiS family protein n=1 Tax=Flavobacterium sp. NG2 TaxID=3097547 RepID=UPI002A7EF1A4|nr:MoaD/ThiS family protein [Flavobacterium sp. NG2]WPR72857.1 MoaD/ThiS family protein [Flavobacterium sp. NG2]
MIINTKYFGLIADITNKNEEQVSLDNSNATVACLKGVMESNYPDLKKTNYSIAVNQVITNIDFSIKNQDEIAFLPPFAGG